MLASSPNTIAETELELEHPAPEDPGKRFRKPRRQRLGIGAWLAIAWIIAILLIAFLCILLIGCSSAPRSDDSAGAQPEKSTTHHEGKVVGTLGGAGAGAAMGYSYAGALCAIHTAWGSGWGTEMPWTKRSGCAR